MLLIRITQMDVVHVLLWAELMPFSAMPINDFDSYFI